MSELSALVRKLIRKTLPSYSCKEEYYLDYANTRLFFDFYLPELRVFIEVQGEQHYKFVQHFHKDIQGFNKQVYRDRLKEEWCGLNNHDLVKLSYTEIPGMTPEEFKKRIVSGK